LRLRTQSATRTRSEMADSFATTVAPLAEYLRQALTWIRDAPLVW
jgi:hypothetical protein